MVNSKFYAVIIVSILGLGVAALVLRPSLPSAPVAQPPHPQPEASIPAHSAGNIVGHITIGPFCPVERADQPCKTPPEAYSSRAVILYESDAKTIKQKGGIDAEGNYKFTLAPGNYFLQVEPAGIGPGEKKPVVVKTKQTSVVNFDIDTGIR